MVNSMGLCGRFGNVVLEDEPCASVSVVIPCYRCAPTLERAVASVVDQSLRPAEVILVDDASGDETREVMNQLGEQFAPGWVKLVFLDVNVGAASARNAGWAAASQPLVAFLDADDAWHQHKLARQVAYLQAHPDVGLCGHGWRLLSASAPLDWALDDAPATPVGKWTVLLSNPFVTPSVMLRRDLPLRFHEAQRYTEDHMLWMALACSGVRMVLLPQDLAAIYKPFGVRGLSANLWRMQRGDMGNYRRLYAARQIGLWTFVALMGFSMLKFGRRLVLLRLIRRQPTSA